MVVEKLKRKKVNPKKSTDPHILHFIYKKTGIKLDYFWLYDFDKAYAVIAGIPGKPQMFISVNAYKNFTKNELDWLLLHETGHYQLWHSTKEAIQQLLFLIIGIFFLSKINNVYSSTATGILLAFVFGVIEIQLQKLHEYEAEKYSLDRLDNPQGMISAGKKSIEGWRKHGLPEHSLFHRFFDRWEISMYYKRIRLAEERVVKG